MARDRSTRNISMMKWVRTSTLTIKNSLSVRVRYLGEVVEVGFKDRALICALEHVQEVPRRKPTAS